MDSFKNILFIFPVMLYYVLEALIVGLFITIVWNVFLQNMLGHINYLHVVAIYWIVKMLFFDVFKLVTGLNLGKAVQEKNNENEEE